jgi:hypothetical protein
MGWMRGVTVEGGVLALLSIRATAVVSSTQQIFVMHDAVSSQLREATKAFFRALRCFGLTARYNHDSLYSAREPFLRLGTGTDAELSYKTQAESPNGWGEPADVFVPQTLKQLSAVLTRVG